MLLIIPDISHFESDIDFHAMKAAGIPAFIAKATESTNYTDPTYNGFYKRGKSVGLIAGAYAFLEPAPGDPQELYFLNVAHLTKGDFQPFVDAEALGLNLFETSQALHLLETKGYRPILYTSYSFWKDALAEVTRWPLWLADYNATMPTLPPEAKLFAWQYTESGSCPGVAKPCDMSHFYGTLDDLKQYLI